MAEREREPDVIEQEDPATDQVDDPGKQPRETVARVDVPATGRTITNLMRAGRVIS